MSTSFCTPISATTPAFISFFYSFSNTSSNTNSWYGRNLNELSILMVLQLALQLARLHQKATRSDIHYNCLYQEAYHQVDHALITKRWAIAEIAASPTVPLWSIQTFPLMHCTHTLRTHIYWRLTFQERKWTSHVSLLSPSHYLAWIFWKRASPAKTSTFQAVALGFACHLRWVQQINKWDPHWLK